MMNHISLLLQSFKLYLTIPTNLRAHLPSTLTLIYHPRINATPLEINGEKIPPNKPAPVILRRVRSEEAVGEPNVLYASTDKIFACDGQGFQVNFGGDKMLKGTFKRGVRWGLECELSGMDIWMEVSVVTNEGFLIKEGVKLMRNRFCPNLSVISEEDEVEEDEDEMKELINMKRVEQGNDDLDGAVNKGVSRAINMGIFVAILGVGLFVSRGSLKRLLGLKLF